jgi:ACS family hexuronate transporter-like MFS transporter
MDYANINFWFQVGYAIGFVLQGRLIDRVGVKRVFFCAVLLWSLATGAHGLATSAVGFMVCRFILGLTEAANYPACVKTTRLWFPAGERAVATGIFNAGTNVGAMMTPMLLPLILHAWGWQAAFLCMASLGAIWLVFWGLKYYNLAYRSAASCACAAPGPLPSPMHSPHRCSGSTCIGCRRS